jgi:hypothetical protein
MIQSKTGGIAATGIAMAITKQAEIDERMSSNARNERALQKPRRGGRMAETMRRFGG